MQTDTKIAIFKGRKIRKTLHSNEWWFSVVDVVEVLTDSTNPRDYWYKMKIREKDESGIELSTNCRQLKLEASDGKKYETDCANTEGMFRIIQSIPSPKAEPFKRWLAKVGYERVQEIENPELATKRTRMLYKLKGYSNDWIEKRMRGIAIREELTDKWQNRGAQEEKDYEILTAQISKAAFGVTPSEYKKIKGLKRENLRDHMDDFELIFTAANAPGMPGDSISAVLARGSMPRASVEPKARTLTMLGERATTEIHRTENSLGIPKLADDARAGGTIAGNARKALEKRLKRPVVSGHNYLREKEGQKRLPDSKKSGDK